VSDERFVQFIFKLVSHGGHFTLVGEGLAVLVEARSILLYLGIVFLLQMTLFVAGATFDHGLSIAVDRFTAWFPLLKGCLPDLALVLLIILIMRSS
jgi:hypothetical protein